MLVLVEHLVRGRRYGARRASTLGRLLARWEAQRGPREVGASLRTEAKRIAELKRELAEAFDEVRSCRSCAEGCASPAGHFPGGRCCGTDSLEVFSPAEVRALKLAGLPPPKVPAPDGDGSAGCLFRGPRGCSLEPEARPARCLVYVCDELRAEIDDHDDHDDHDGVDRVHRLRAQLDAAQSALGRHSRPRQV